VLMLPDPLKVNRNGVCAVTDGGDEGRKSTSIDSSRNPSSVFAGGRPTGALPPGSWRVS